MPDIVLALGSNLGDRLANLDGALRLLAVMVMSYVILQHHILDMRDIFRSFLVYLLHPMIKRIASAMTEE